LLGKYVGSIWAALFLFVLWLLTVVTGFGLWAVFEVWLLKLAGEPVTPPPLPVQKEAVAESSEKEQSAKSAPKKKKPAPLPPEFQSSLKAVEKKSEKPVRPIPREEGLPPLNMLMTEQAARDDERTINQTAGMIMKTLSEFGIPATVIGYRIGPSVTQFAVQPGYIKRQGVSDDDEAQQMKVRVAQIAALHQQKKRIIVVSSGAIGAGMAAAVLKLGPLPGVDRPALAVQMVTETGPFVLLDIGANMDSTGNNLYQFAHMGSLYAERVLGVVNPRVGLLSIGEERGKGDQAVQQATETLDAEGTLNFIGNVEGRDLVKHMADVAVCDAMVGNVTMKFFEGLATFIFGLWEKEFRGSIRGKLAYLLMRPSIGRIRTLFDYEKMGASPLLGVKGMVLITHGSAKRRMIEFALDAGVTAGRARIPDLIADAFRGKPRHG